jgi:hypothetical protein
MSESLHPSSSRRPPGHTMFRKGRSAESVRRRFSMTRWRSARMSNATPNSLRQGISERIGKKMHSAPGRGHGTVQANSLPQGISQGIFEKHHADARREISSPAVGEGAAQPRTAIRGKRRRGQLISATECPLRCFAPPPPLRCCSAGEESQTGGGRPSASRSRRIRYVQRNSLSQGISEGISKKALRC